MKLKIAVLGAKGIPHPGGIENVMTEVGTRLVARGHEVDIFVRNYYMPDKEFSRYRGIGLPRSVGIHTKNLDAITHSITAVFKIITGGYNIVYFNSVGLSVLSWIPRLFGMKTVVHTHGLDWQREKWGWIAKKMIRLSAYSSVKFPDLTICVCMEDKRFLEEKYNIPCAYIPNGANHGTLRPPELIKKYGLSEKDYVLFMARLVPEKGCHLLLQAWQTMTDNEKKMKKLVIAGDSNHRDAYYFNLKKSDNLPDIIFTGFATGEIKEELMSNAFCFVQPSTLEGLPLSILEALSYGLYVIASDIIQNRDALGDCGITFHSGSPDNLAKTLKKVLMTPEEKIGAEGIKARQFAEKEYNWDGIADQIEGRLLTLLK